MELPNRANRELPSSATQRCFEVEPRRASRRTRTSNAMSYSEQGQRNPGLNILARLARALNVSLGVLVADLRVAGSCKNAARRPKKPSREA
jgi:hypothetical protein